MKRMLAIVTLALCTAAMAQEKVPAPQEPDDEMMVAQAEAPPAPPQEGQFYKRMAPGAPEGPGMMRERTPMKFWADSETAAKLKLTDQQKQQLETSFTNYRLKLIDQRAAVQREEVRLEPLIEADKLDEAAITKQIDALINARSALERTTAMMGVDIRKVLSTEQWKQLREMRHGMMLMRGPEGRGGERRERMKQFRRHRDYGDSPAPTPPPQPKE